MIKSEIITIEYSQHIEEKLKSKYPGLLRWAIVKIALDNKVVVNLSYETSKI